MTPRPATDPPALSIPEPQRPPETRLQALRLNALYALLFAVFIGIAGFYVLGAVPFTKYLLSLSGKAPSIAFQVVLSYLLLVLGLMVFVYLWGVVGQSARTVNHFGVRVLGFLVVGLSDLFRGSAFVAMCVYWLITLTALITLVLFIHLFVDGTRVGGLAWNAMSGSSVGPVSVGEVVIASYLVAVSAILLSLPAVTLLSGRWRDMALRPRLDLLGVEDSEANFVVAHASDLHAGCRREGGVHAAMNSVITAIAASDRDIHAVVLSGDITDDGHHASWMEFLGVEGLDRLLGRLVLAPGNHDLNHIREDNKLHSLIDIPTSRRVGSHTRALNYLNAARRIMGRRCHVICPYTGAWTTLEEVMTRAQPDLECWDGPSGRGKFLFQPAELLARLFPMAVRVEGEAALEHVRFLVWNSIKLNRSPLNNSMGEIDAEQLKRANEVLRQTAPSAALVHVMHHQLGVPSAKPHARDPATRGQRFYAMGMGLLNPYSLLKWLEVRGAPSLLLHGHRHKYYVAQEKDSRTTIVSAPSATKRVATTFCPKVPVGLPGRWLLLGLDISGPCVRLTRVEAKESVNIRADP